MTSEMIERVARAIGAAEIAWKAENGGDDAPCVDCPDDVKARAALQEMRVPTEAMVKQADLDENLLRDDYWRVWTVMIDDALKEPK